MDIIKLSADLRDWIADDDNYLIDEFYLERDISPEEFEGLLSEHESLRSAHRYAMGVQRHKIVKGALEGRRDRLASLRFLEQHHGWNNKAGEAVEALFGGITDDDLKRMRTLEPSSSIDGALSPIPTTDGSSTPTTITDVDLPSDYTFTDDDIPHTDGDNLG